MLAFFYVNDFKTRELIILSAIVSYLGLVLTKALIPVLQPIHLRRNLFGYDINKKGEEFVIDTVVSIAHVSIASLKSLLVFIDLD